MKEKSNNLFVKPLVFSGQRTREGCFSEKYEIKVKNFLYQSGMQL